MGSIFLLKLLGFVSKAIKLLLTELVGQYRNILPLAFSALTSLRSVKGKDSGKYILALTSHSVNKSIILTRFYCYFDEKHILKLFPLSSCQIM